jgi:Fic family protein
LQRINWDELISLISKASRGLARYDGVLQGIVNPDLLLSPLMTQEAVLSSHIEGTQVTFESYQRRKWTTTKNVILSETY